MMLSGPELVSLAELWNAFVLHRGVELCLEARQIYLSDEFRNSGFANKNEFGSPLDYLEQKFISTIEDRTLTLYAPGNQIEKLPTRISNGTSSLFATASVFENTES